MSTLLTSLIIFTIGQFANALNFHDLGGNRPLCYVCIALIGDLDKALQKPWEKKDIDKIAVTECEALEAKGKCRGYPECKDLCEGIIREYGEEIQELWIAKNLGPEFICGQLKQCDPPPPPPLPPKPFTQKLGDTGDRSTNKGIGRFVQVGDVHWDPYYTPGSPSICDEPACCRPSDDVDPHDNQPAGPFGNLNNCDAPTTVVATMFDQIKAIHLSTPFDFAICDGDGPPHDIWNQTQGRHIQIITGLKNYFQQAIPDKPTYYIVGNHEGMPVDQFENPPDDNWLYHNLSSMFKDWIDRTIPGQADSPPASTVFSYAGYYTTLLLPGLRMVHVNCGYFDGGNYWLKWTNNSQDMGHQYKWLASTLQQARALKEKVYLLQHFPMGSFQSFQQTKYYNLYNAYSDIITAVFSGHTHIDNFHLWGALSSSTGGKPFAVNYSPGSVTTYGGRWPQFRVYTYDRATFEILDYEHYHMDVGASNKQGKAIWQLGYSARALYGLPDLSPQSWMNMILSMEKQPALFDSFMKNRLGGMPYTYGRDINGTICNLLSATPSDFSKCKKIFPGQTSLEDWMKSVNPDVLNHV